MHKFFLTSASLFALAACGGGSTGGGVDVNGISTDPLSGPEIDQVLAGVATSTGTNLNLFDGTDISSEEGIASAIGGLESTLFDTDFDSVTARDLTAPGSATYTGVVVLADVDASDVFDENAFEEDVVFVEESAEDLEIPTFVMLGRSEMTVAFGATPEVSGGANGFIGLNIETLEETFANTSPEDIELSENPDIAEIIALLPTVNVGGGLTYSGGEILDFDPETDASDDKGLGFDVAGNLQLSNALTGDGSRTVQIDGRGLAAFADNLGVGVMDLNTDGQTLGGLVIGVSD